MSIKVVFYLILKNIYLRVENDDSSKQQADENPEKQPIILVEALLERFRDEKSDYRKHVENVYCKEYNPCSCSLCIDFRIIYNGIRRKPRLCQ